MIETDEIELIPMIPHGTNEGRHESSMGRRGAHAVPARPRPLTFHNPSSLISAITLLLVAHLRRVVPRRARRSGRAAGGSQVGGNLTHFNSERLKRKTVRPVWYGWFQSALAKIMRKMSRPLRLHRSGPSFAPPDPEKRDDQSDADTVFGPSRKNTMRWVCMLDVRVCNSEGGVLYP